MVSVAIKTKAPALSRLVADRWTQNLANAGWTPVADFFLDNYHRLTPPLKYSEAMLTIHIMRHKWDKGAPYPSFNLLAKRMGISAEAARLLARSLEKKGYLYRQLRVSQTNKFHLDSLFAALEKLKAADAIETVARPVVPANPALPMPKFYGGGEAIEIRTRTEDGQIIENLGEGRRGDVG